MNILRTDLITRAAVLGFVLDLLIGDPEGLYHPVRLIGLVITGLERMLRRLFPETARGERIAGALLALLTVGLTGTAAGLLLLMCSRLGHAAVLVCSVLMSASLLAGRSLRDEAMKVYRALQAGALLRARQAVGRIVGRDTGSLNAEEITKAAVETVAENASDGVIAPLFYLLLGGPVLGWCYKAVNTLDSMVGYRNARYQYFGSFSARLDDVCNFLPARLSALLMIASSTWLGLDARQAQRIWRRDRRRHLSPNSGQTEAVMAGALHLQLGGDASYFGAVVHKETLGDALRPAEPSDIPRACNLMTASSVLALLLFAAVRCTCMFVLAHG